jgi:hypothetical protein
VAAVAHSRDLPVSPVAYHANPVAHAAAAVPNHLAFEVQGVTSPIGLHVDQEYQDGGIVLGDEPGIGIRVDEDRIKQLRAAAAGAAVTGPHVRPPRAGLRLVPDPHADGSDGVPASRLVRP